MKCLSCTIVLTLLGLGLAAAASGLRLTPAARSPLGSASQRIASEYNPPGRGGGYPGGTRFDPRPQPGSEVSLERDSLGQTPLT